jgi:uncharacterized protein YecE (DUF72 family)
VTEEERKQAREAWIARREARRAKQREQNVVRAQKMHDARMAFETDAKPNPSGSGSASRSKYFIGCSGWYYWHWRHCFYPQGSSSSTWFKHYTTHFKTVELNAPFYSWPTLATVQTWNRQCVDRSFVYTIKVNELITHTKRFSRCKELVRDFGLIADLLGRRFGCFLFQLPPSFRYSKAALDRLLKALDPARRNVVEFRHRSWWNEGVFRAFRDSNTIFCSTSGPRLPDELVKTADDIYIRFHGTKRWYRHDYSAEELSVWTKSIRESRAKRVWAYFNNDREGYAIKNAEELIRQLKNTSRMV